MVDRGRYREKKVRFNRFLVDVETDYLRCDDSDSHLYGVWSLSSFNISIED